MRLTRRSGIVLSFGSKLPAEAVDDTGLNPEIVLPGAVEVGVKIVDLDGSQRDVPAQSNIGAAPCCRCKGVARSRASTRYASRELLAAGQNLDKGKHPAAGHRKIDARTKQVAELMSGDTGRQPGDFAAAELADDPDASRKIGSHGTGTALAIFAAGPVSRIKANELVCARNVKSTVFLS